MNEITYTPATMPKSGFPDNCSFLDIQLGMGYCGEDKQLYGEMVLTFREESKLEQIEKFYQEKDLKNYRILVHYVKSTALSIGATALSEEAKAAQQALSCRYGASGEEAIEMLLSGGRFDLILLDIHMPDEDGFDVIRKLKADSRLKDIPVIFLTADDQNAETEGFKAGATIFIS